MLRCAIVSGVRENDGADDEGKERNDGECGSDLDAADSREQLVEACSREEVR